MWNVSLHLLDRNRCHGVQVYFFQSCIKLLPSLLGKEIKLVKMEGEGTMGDKGIWESGRERGNRVKVRAKG